MDSDIILFFMAIFILLLIIPPCLHSIYNNCCCHLMSQQQQQQKCNSNCLTTDYIQSHSCCQSCIGNIDPPNAESSESNISVYLNDFEPRGYIEKKQLYRQIRTPKVQLLLLLCFAFTFFDHIFPNLLPTITAEYIFCYKYRPRITSLGHNYK